MPVGLCALCKVTAELRDSHLLPAGVYKYLREPESGFPHPILVTQATTVQTPAQVHDHLLCEKCELRFEQNGEDWLLRSFPQRSGRFPMREALMKSSNKKIVRAGTMYYSPFDQTFQLDKLIYFAVSIFWRASVHTWERAQHLMSRASLPQGIEEDFRHFLLGESKFPQYAVLLITVSASTPIPHLTHPVPLIPKTAQATAQGYVFVIPGVQFKLLYGDLPKEMLSASVTNPPHAILVTDHVEREVRSGAEELRKTSRPVGSLSKFNNEPE